uniref:CUB domain-containing protein 1 isoform X1 n=1 Tax=Sus scrofa TaxID=9823 RepID=A0A480FKI1_PIG
MHCDGCIQITIHHSQHLNIGMSPLGNQKLEVPPAVLPCHSSPLGFLFGNPKGHLRALLYAKSLGQVQVIPQAPWACGHPARGCQCSHCLYSHLWGGRRHTVRSQTQEGSQGMAPLWSTLQSGPWSIWGVGRVGGPLWGPGRAGRCPPQAGGRTRWHPAAGAHTPWCHR